MIRENFERNSRIYELWNKGYTVKEISFETSIPPSSVGYYVRKFNKRARSGDPIPFLPEREKLDEKEMAFNAFLKNLFSQNLKIMILKSKDGLNDVYKLLSVVKLIKELQRDLSPTLEEEKALEKNWIKILQQIMGTMTLPEIETEKSDSVSDTPKKKKRYEQEITWTATVNSSKRGY